MAQSRLFVSVQEIAHIEVTCGHCQQPTVFPLNPPHEHRDDPVRTGILKQCPWCLTKRPPWFGEIVTQLQKALTKLQEKLDLKLRLAINYDVLRPS